MLINIGFYIKLSSKLAIERESKNNLQQIVLKAIQNIHSTCFVKSKNTQATPLNF